MQTVVATARRSLLIKEVLDEAAFRSSVADDVEKERYGTVRYDAGAIEASTLIVDVNPQAVKIIHRLDVELCAQNEKKKEK